MTVPSIPIIGITGRSGSGKSSLTRHYAALGYPTVDGDALSREIMVPGSACLQELVAAFGAEILFGDGTLNRRHLGALAFASPEANARLVGITHPHILAAMLERAAKAQADGARLFFVDGAMILGGPFEPYCKPLILVSAPLRLSVSRIILRDGISKVAAMKRLDAQPPLAVLQSAADYEIVNDGGERRLFEKGEAVLADILQKLETGEPN